MKKLILSLALLLTSGYFAGAFAQQLGPEWGETEEVKTRMLRNLTFLNETVNTKQYGRAAYYLQELMDKAPRAHKNIYLIGSNMYRARANAATDKAEKLVYIDSLIMVYDKGIESFGFQDAALRKQFIERKAIDYMNLNPLDRAGIAERFRGTIAEMGNDVDPTVILNYFNELSTDYQNDDITTEEFLMEFDRLYPMMVSLGTEEQAKQYQAILAASGAANCESLEEIYSSRIDAEPENEELLGTVLALLNRADCTGTDFYLKTAELYYKLKPSAQTAIIIGAYYQAKGDNATARRYYNEALESSTDQAERSKLSVTVAVSQMNEGNAREAYNFATRAAQYDPANPMAYYIMGMAQNHGTQSIQDAFQRKTVYWLAVDNLAKARQLASANPSAGLSVSVVEREIARLQTGFPTGEEIFVETLEEGAPYTVNAGWITGRTTVRARP